MRGKNFDVGFISEFVQECCSENKTSPKDISSEARIRLDRIDSELRRIEELKLKRSKLLDVISSFNVEEETTDNEQKFSSNDAVRLKMSPEIISNIRNNNNASDINLLIQVFGATEKAELFYTLKQLCESGVLLRTKDRKFVPGPNWPEETQV